MYYLKMKNYLTIKCYCFSLVFNCCFCGALYNWLHSFSNIGFTAACVCLCLSVVWLDVARRGPAKSHTLKTLILQYLISRLFILRGWWVHRRFIKTCLSKDCQQEAFLLKHIIDKNKNTVFGQKYNFSRMRSKKDFVAEVPLSTYDDYCSYFNLLSQSHPRFLQKKIMTNDPVVYLATSSGTTGKNKILPLTSFTKKTAALQISPHLSFISSSLGGLYMGRVLVISYSAEKILCKSGLYKGPVSSHIGRFLPYLVVPREVYNIHNEVLVLHLISVFALSEREICQIEALFSTLVYSFWRHVENYWPMICNIIEFGKLEFDEEMFNKNISRLCTGDFLFESKPEHLAENTFNKNGKSLGNKRNQTTMPMNIISDHLNVKLLKNLESRLNPDPKRANELREIFKKGFNRAAQLIWPSLKYVRMINTGGFAPYATLLEQVHMKGVMQLSLLHAASEGFIGLNLASNRDWRERVCYTLQPEFGFFEFIHENDIYSDHQSKTYFIEELEINEKYEIVYTSQTGLYRYKTGDVIKITGHLHNCPSYTFEYRKGQVLNLFWEKTPEYVLNKAVEGSINKMNDIILVDFVATEDLYMPDNYRTKHSRKHYVLFVEVCDIKNQEIILNEEHLKLFDEELMDVFELYATLRRDCSIGQLRAIQLQKGGFTYVRTSNFSPQSKLPRVTRDPQHIKNLLQYSLNQSQTFL